MFGGQFFAVGQNDGVRVQKPGVGADEFKPAAFQLLHPVIGKFPDQPVFARHDLREVKAQLRGLKPPGGSSSGQVPDFGGIEQRLGGHAPAQDAQAADLPTALEDHRFQARAGGRPGGGVTAAAAADDRHVEIMFAHAREDAGRTGKIQIETGRIILDDMDMSELIYPRSPRETMAGWSYLPRYVDKIRLHLAGKLHADYQENLGKGFDALWLKHAGVTHEQMLEVVKSSTIDGEVCDWVRIHVQKTPAEKAAHRDELINRPGLGTKRRWSV